MSKKRLEKYKSMGKAREEIPEDILKKLEKYWAEDYEEVYLTSPIFKKRRS